MLTLPLTSITINVSAEQQTQIDAFMKQFDERAIGIFLSTPWQNKYQTESYNRGIERADDQLKTMLTASEQALLPSLNMEAAALVTTSIHANELDFLHKRANKSLAKWIDDLLFDTRSILHEQAGIVSVDDIHGAITDRINVTTSRARVINVTEIAQASQRSVIKEIETINAQSDEVIEARWITVRDSKVRHLHANWHGKIMSNEQASRNITISPWNCRCGIKPVIENRAPARAEAKFKAERKLLMNKEGK
jgi:SPP1 gp7 family putative phage head morphogenesis protein